MANYYAVMRSNYFYVNDEAAFQKWIHACGIGTVWTETDQEVLKKNPKGQLSNKKRVGFGSMEQGMPGQVPTPGYDPESGEDDPEIDFLDGLKTFLAPKQVAVVVEVGNEALRYLLGIVAVVSPEHGIRVGRLEDTVNECRVDWGVDIDYPEY